MEEQISQIKEYLNKVNQASSLEELDQIYLELFGKLGVVSKTTEQFKNLSKEEVSKVAPQVISLKKQLEAEIDQARVKLKELSYKQLEQENLDLNSPKIQSKQSGKLHPLTIFEHEIIELFKKLGFSQYEAPLIDTDYNNFEALNIPQNHPARDLWDTLYIDQSNLDSCPGQLLLRTHTSNSQIHIMNNHKPPIRMMVLGRCFRYENLDARHEHTFDQFEIVYIDKGLNMGNLQYLSEQLLKEVFGEDIKVRLKPKYYPFVEPGAGVDGMCIFCQGKGCKICGGTGWLELAGAGMIHPKVLEAGGIDPNIYSGIAWGFGPDRMVMLKNGIEDMRILRSGDLKQLYKEDN